MNLQRKFIVTTSIIILIVTGSIAAINSYFISKGFENLETKRIHEDLNKTYETYLATLSGLEVVTVDWSYWNELYDFARRENSTFASDYVTYVQFTNLGISFMLIFDENGTVLTSMQTNEAQKDLVHFSSLQFIQGAPPVQSQQELFILENTVGAITRTPILHSDGSGPAGGTIVFGTFFDHSKEEAYHKILNKQISFISADTQSLEGASLFSTTANYTAYLKKTPTTITTYMVIHTQNAEPTLVIISESPRDIYQEGKKSETYFFIALFLAAILFVFFTVLLSEILFNKLIKQMKELQMLAQRIINGSYEIHTTVITHDELGMLAASLDQLREQLKEQQQAIDKGTADLEDGIKRRTMELEEKNEMLERFNKTMVDRELRMVELKKKIEELEARQKRGAP
jgi:sensor domain CHASE-containing protein